MYSHWEMTTLVNPEESCYVVSIHDRNSKEWLLSVFVCSQASILEGAGAAACNTQRLSQRLFSDFKGLLERV